MDQQRRSKRRRLGTPMHATEDSINGLYQAATPEEKKNWNGFCEIESEPVREYACSSSCLAIRLIQKL